MHPHIELTIAYGIAGERARFAAEQRAVRAARPARRSLRLGFRGLRARGPVAEALR